jgi:hypothetical protein
MRALLSPYGSRVDVGPMMRLAAQRAASGAPLRMCAAEECDAPVVIGVMSTGEWR